MGETETETETETGAGRSALTWGACVGARTVSREDGADGLDAGAPGARRPDPLVSYSGGLAVVQASFKGSRNDWLVSDSRVQL